jgi:hypothetical protein
MPAAILHPGMAGNNGGGSQVLVQILHQNENPEFTGLCFKEIGVLLKPFFPVIR